jgi:hypothetical protein
MRNIYSFLFQYIVSYALSILFQQYQFRVCTNASHAGYKSESKDSAPAMTTPSAAIVTPQPAGI